MIFLRMMTVNEANCLIKKVLEMGIVASNKKVLEINETYLPWQGPRGGGDEADDAAATGGSGQGGEPISAQPQKREERDLERAGGAFHLVFCGPTYPRRSRNLYFGMRHG